MKNNLILHGVHIGEHSFEASRLIEETKRRCVDLGLNHVTARVCCNFDPQGNRADEEALYEWARYCAENSIYFVFQYSIKNVYSDYPESVFTEEMVTKLYEIAGEYFLGDSVAEMAEFYTLKTEGYRETEGFLDAEGQAGPCRNLTDINDAKEHYLNYLQNMIRADHRVGIKDVYTVQPVLFSKYDCEAGISVPQLEIMMDSNPHMMMASARGAAAAYHLPVWGTYFAIEWYAGRHHEDGLKRKRMLIAYKYAYLSGSAIFCLESGDECIASYGTKYDYDSEICREYRDNLKKFSEIMREFPRPVGGPKVKVGFVYGNLDGYYGMNRGSTLWGQISNEDFGMSDAEYSWRLPEELAQSCNWHESYNFGMEDFSTHIPYGLYDIVPAEAGSEVFSRYEYLIFIGWNTMTEEIYRDLVKYVWDGGNVILTAAHLNTNAARSGEYHPILNGDVSGLFGCRLKEVFTSKHGSKFAYEGYDNGIRYPGPRDFLKDPADPDYNLGYARYARTEITVGKMTAQLSDDFACRDTGVASIVENKFGKGHTYLFTTIEYPGCNAIYMMYRNFVKIHLNALHARSDIQVIGSPEISFAVYEGRKIFLLNTALTYPASVKVIRDGEESFHTLLPGEIKIVQDSTSV